MRIDVTRCDNCGKEIRQGTDYQYDPDAHGGWFRVSYNDIGDCRAGFDFCSWDCAISGLQKRHPKNRDGQK